MKNLVITLGSVIFLIFTSCSTVDTSLSAKDVSKNQACEKLANSIIAGFQNRDYALFSKHFTPELKERFPEKNFKASIESFNKRYGNLKFMTSMGNLKISGLDVVFWKARFTNNKNDVLIRLVVGKLDGVYNIFGWSIE